MYSIFSSFKQKKNCHPRSTSSGAFIYFFSFQVLTHINAIVFNYSPFAYRVPTFFSLVILTLTIHSNRWLYRIQRSNAIYVHFGGCEFQIIDCCRRTGFSGRRKIGRSTRTKRRKMKINGNYQSTVCNLQIGVYEEIFWRIE